MITAIFEEGETKTTITDEVYQFDYGQKLLIEGLNLPDSFDVDFSFGNNASYDSITQEGISDRGASTVSIPDEILAQDKTRDYTVYIYIFEEDESSGETTYVITMPVKTRPKRESN